LISVHFLSSFGIQSNLSIIIIIIITFSSDCSGEAWVGSPVVGSNDVRPVMECSNQGTCDRESGKCICFTNYEGIACERTKCPNDCNDRGICYNARRLASEADRTYMTPWDAERNFGCICDSGYRGYDCSLIECPTGADILGGFGNEAGRDCSGRGLCDYLTGQCECFRGYYGEKCDVQEILYS
jgi:hypothetical protein